jgi:hypothetical protein
MVLSKVLCWKKEGLWKDDVAISEFRIWMDVSFWGEIIGA